MDCEKHGVMVAEELQDEDEKENEDEKTGSDSCVCRVIGGNSVEKNDEKEDERDDERDAAGDDESTSDDLTDDKGHDERDEERDERDEERDEKDDDEILSDDTCGSWEYEYVQDERIDPSPKHMYMRIPRMAVASIPDQAWHGGYNFTFIKPVPDRICCSICTKVLHDPHLTGCCGQYFCESCLEHRFKKQKTACPHCRHKDFNHILDKALKREIDEIEIQCTKQGLGCQWVGELGTLQTHLDSDKGCGYLEVQCSNKCGAKMMRKELKAHLERKCSLRNIQCHFEDTYQTITSKHYGECPHYPLPCPNKCGTTGIRRADMDSRCELESVECPFREAGCKVHVMRKEFDSHMSGNQQNHLLMLLGAYQETKRKLDENRREMDENHRELDENRRELDENRRELNESRTKLHYTRLRLMELEESQYNQMTLKNIGDRVTFRMYDYSLYKHTSRVWLSPPFYLGDGYKLCLAVYANGRGAGAGTHVSVELLQMKGEHDDKLRWGGGSIPTYLSIRMMAQRFKAQHRKNSFLLEGHICSGCLTRLPAHKNFRVFMSEGRSEVSESKFIDHQTAEQLMVLNDTIALNIGYHIESSAYGSD